MGAFFDDLKQWLLDVLLWVPRKCWELLLDGLAAVIEAIPSPAFLSDLVTNMGLLPEGFGYLLGVFAVPEGLAMITGAYVIRFLIRRIPVIG